MPNTTSTIDNTLIKIVEILFTYNCISIRLHIHTIQNYCETTIRTENEQFA